MLAATPILCIESFNSRVVAGLGSVEPITCIEEIVDVLGDNLSNGVDGVVSG